MKALPSELLKLGGPWLGAARRWTQRNKRNGCYVTWGSRDEIKPPMTAADVEDLAAHVAAELWPPSAPPEVLAAARAITRWHYGAADPQPDLEETVLVLRSEWNALRRAVDAQPGGDR